MAYYVTAIPVIYFGSQLAANKVVSTASVWFATCDVLCDDSAATIDAADCILKIYANLPAEHPAFVSKTYLQAAVDYLKYISSQATTSNNTWRVFRKNYKNINNKILRHTSRVEQRISLFREVYQLANSHQDTLVKEEDV